MKKAFLSLLALMLCACSILKARQIPCTDQLEPNDSRDLPAQISSNSSLKATIASPEDVDFYHFHVGANEILTVRLDSIAADFNIVLYRDKPTYNWLYTLEVGSSTNTGTAPEEITISDGPSADYYVKVVGTGDIGCYQLSVSTSTYPACPDVYEPNELGSGVYLSEGSPVSARISASDDVDLFHFDNPPGYQYTKIDLIYSDAADYNLNLIDTRFEDNGDYHYLYLNSNYSSTGITGYFDNYNERSYYIMVEAGSHHTDCYQLLVQTSSTPFPEENARKSAAIPKTAAVFPIPAKDVIYSVFNSKVNTSQEVIVTDMSGKVVLKKKFAVIAGANKLEILLPASLTDGVYIISNGVSSQKFVLKR